MPKFKKGQLDVINKGNQFTEANAAEYAKKAHASRARNKTARQVFGMILSSLPQLDDRTRDTLTKLGVKNIDNSDIMTLIGAAMAQKAIKGDVKAAQLIFKTAGQDVDSAIAKERNAIEKQKLEIEREKLEAQKAALNSGDVVVENTLIKALQQASICQELQTDVPQGADGNEEDA